MTKPRVRLIHWNAGEAAGRVSELRARGLDVLWEPFGNDVLGALLSDPPAVFIIDLDRSPARGRDLAVHLRRRKVTRRVPLVFAGGESAKVERVRELLPDAEYASWSGVPAAVKRALRCGQREPVVPESVFAAYSGTPLTRKLGVRPGSVVALVGAPDGFEDTLGALPEGAMLRRGARGRCDLAVWFVRSRGELERRVGRMGEFAGPGGLWIAWPKKASGIESDLSQTVVRNTGLASGLVDYKVCSIDATWSGLRFARRKPEAARRR
ncbi:MAG: hypothetical protein ABIG03_01070 [Candidatus Eisenbacteria bacterium]